MKRILFTLLSLCLTVVTFADQPFRTQRYDALNVVDVNEESIVFIGNSITNMHEWFDAWGSDQRVVGFGVSGAVSNELRDNIEAVLIGHPAKMFILIGTNDLGTYNNEPDIPTANMRTVLRRITKESPNTEVYVQAVLPTCGNYAARVPYTQTLNSKYKEVIQEIGSDKVHYLDTFTPLLSGTVLNSGYTADGLHLYASGYQVWCHAIKDKVGLTPSYPTVAKRKITNPSITGYSGSFLMRASYFKELPVNDGDILIVGDDVTHQGEWHSLLHSSKVKNRGNGWGYNSLNVEQMTQVIPTILHDQPSPAQIWLNIAHKDANNSVSPETFKTNVENFIATAKQNLNAAAQTRFVLAAIHPSSTAATNTNYITKYNAAMKEIADANEDVDYVDTYTPLLKGSVANTDYITGGRLYGLGYIKMATTMLSKIQEADPTAYVMSEEDATTHYELVKARNDLGVFTANTADFLDGITEGQYKQSLVEALETCVGKSWALLAGDPTSEQLAAMKLQLKEARNAVDGIKTTTIADGAFADNTTWYTLQIAAPGFYISDNGTASYIALDATSTKFEDADLWCFTGNESDGYRIYNKKRGVKHVLASPKTMSGTTGSTAYPVMKNTILLGTTYVAEWAFDDTDILGDDTPAYYMSQKINSSNILNNRESKLAFWTAGKDAGSAVQILAARTDVTVSMSTGSFTAGSGSFSSNWQATGDYPVNLNSGVNNMTSDGDNLKIYSGTALTSTYTITAPDGWRVLGYQFDMQASESAAEGVTLTTCDNQVFTASTTAQTVEVSGWKEDAASFVLSGANKGILLTNMRVMLVRSTNATEEQVNVFITTSSPNYRIPAIATTRNNTVIAVADYRYGGADIGYGSVELRRRTSTDCGQTWSDILEFTDGEYASTPTPKYDAAYGDPCIVADRTSDRQMILSCSGNTGFPSGTRQVHQGITRFYSTDEGKSWSKPVNLESIFYSFFDNGCSRGPIQSMFIGSGRIFQSRIVKVADYYRLYCSGLVKDKNGTYCNYVFYSDDFGETWNVLGDINTPPIPSGADEPKTEELPDGSIICSSRTTGRWFNIFTFTDSEKAEGSWGTVAKSDSSNKGVYGASCNGEIMIVPAKRNADGKSVFLALHSVPAASSRINVSIYYKGLPDLESFSTPSVFAANWEGKHQASKMGSAYSTMTILPNDHIGFLYEESTFGKDYTIVFKDYSIEQITDSAYSYDATLDRTEWLADQVQIRIDELFSGEATNYVGSIDKTKKVEVDAAVARFRLTKSQADYEAIINVIRTAQIKVQSTATYLINNKLYPTLYLSHNGTRFTGLARNENNETQNFVFVPATTEGQWYIYNPKKKLYLQNTPAVYNEVPTTTLKSSAGAYRVESNYDGESVLMCVTPTNSTYPAVHLDSSKKLVPWESSADASKWYIIVKEDPSSVEELSLHNMDEDFSRTYNLQGQIVDDHYHGIVVSAGRKILR